MNPLIIWPRNSASTKVFTPAGPEDSTGSVLIHSATFGKVMVLCQLCVSFGSRLRFQRSYSLIQTRYSKVCATNGDVEACRKQAE
jgi:hypothetical protein